MLAVLREDFLDKCSLYSSSTLTILAMSRESFEESWDAWPDWISDSLDVTFLSNFMFLTAFFMGITYRRADSICSMSSSAIISASNSSNSSSCLDVPSFWLLLASDLDDNTNDSWVLKVCEQDLRFVSLPMLDKVRSLFSGLGVGRPLGGRLAYLRGYSKIFSKSMTSSSGCLWYPTELWT